MISPTRTTRKKRLFLILIPLLLPGALFASGSAEEVAQQTSLQFFDRLIVSGKSDLIDVGKVGSIEAGDFFPIHHPVTGEAVYGLVPIRSDGRVIANAAVDREGEHLIWFSIGDEGATFPAVTEAEARGRLAEETGDAALLPSLVGTGLTRGTDGRLYWRFESPSGEVRLVDCQEREAPILGTSEHPARSVLEPRVPSVAPNSAVGSQVSQVSPGKGTSTRVLPPAYSIPGIPYHYQIDWEHCGPASWSMIMDFWGEEINQRDIVDVVNWGGADSISWIDDWIRTGHFSGMSVSYRDSTLQGWPERQLGYSANYYDWGAYRPFTELKELVAGHYPVMIFGWGDLSESFTHGRVLRGYDDDLDVFVFHDPYPTVSYTGPSLLIDQTTFIDDIWPIWEDSRSATFTAPWELEVVAPTNADVGDTFDLDLTVVYTGPSPFNSGYQATSCQATVSLPAGLSLLSGTATQALPDMVMGDTATTTWHVIADGPAGEYAIPLQSQGTVTASSHSYPSYTDSIGGHGRATLTVGAGRVAGWEAETRLTSDTGSSQTCFPGARSTMIGDDGTIHTVWEETQDGNHEIYYRECVAGVWQTAVRLTSDSYYSESPAIALEDDGDVHVVWTESRANNQDLYYRYRDGGGWSATEQVTAFGGQDRNPSIVAHDDMLYLAWERYFDIIPMTATKSLVVQFQVRADTGWVGVPIEPDAALTKESAKPSLAYGPDNLIHLVYERESAALERDKIRYRSYDGLAWSSATVLSTNVSFSRGPVVTTGLDSSVHVVWMDGENGAGDIFYATYDGAAWQATEQIVTAPDGQVTPSVAVDGDGKVYVAWSDHRHGEPEIYLKVKEEGSWGDEARLSYGDEASTLPCVASKGSDVCVIWTDLRDGNSEIYFREKTVSTEVAGRPMPWAAEGAVFLSAPAPHPFSAETRFSFTLPTASPVTIQVFDLAGRRVRTLADGAFGAGTHPAVWDGRNENGREVAPGVYFVRGHAAKGDDVRRVILVR